MKRYKFDNAHEWLGHYSQHTADVKGITGLLGIIAELAGQLDADTIQDLYQSEMDADGYFDEVQS
jgi:hypothetical protein